MGECFVENEGLSMVIGHKQTDEYNESQWFDEFKSPKQYVEAKIKMLMHDMYIRPTEEEVKHLMSLKTPTAIDNAVHSIIDRYWK
jgi:hypothetical protein